MIRVATYLRLCCAVKKSMVFVVYHEQYWHAAGCISVQKLHGPRSYMLYLKTSI